MATVDTGDLGTLTFTSVDVVDPDATGELYIRLTYSLDTTSATETLVGFEYWHDDESGSTTPVWVDATAATEVQGDGDTPTVYEVLVPVPLATTGATWWETFEEYPLGSLGTLNGGGSMWGGAWNVRGGGLSWTDGGDDFQSYATGTIGTLSGGTGFSGSWVIGTNG